MGMMSCFGVKFVVLMVDVIERTDSHEIPLCLGVKYRFIYTVPAVQVPGKVLMQPTSHIND